MSTLVSFAALLLSVFLAQMSAGVLAPLDALAGAAAGFSKTEIGLLGSGHFFGFFVGCFVTPRLIGTIGHSRAYAAFAAIGTIGVVLHPVLTGPWFWVGLRVLTGFMIAGCYTTMESWLQAKVTRETRGGVFALYRVTDLIGSLLAQLLVAVLDPTSYVAYNVVAVFGCLALLPLVLTRHAAPPTPVAPRLQPLLGWQISPVAVMGALMSGVIGPAFRMVGPVYALDLGLSNTGIAWFLGASVIGGALIQIPVGRLADRHDRRKVLIAVSALGAITALAFVLNLPQSPMMLYLASGFFGASAFSIYSLAAAHANDHCAPEQIVELNAALMFYYGLSAIVSPTIAAMMMNSLGPSALFIWIIIGFGGLILFTLYRLQRRPAPIPREPYRYWPRTSAILARLIKRDGHAGRQPPEKPL